jgi:uncharacterized RDD family membrane protein YckC
VSDIPIGSPPVPPGRHAAPGGWYPDPVNAAQERYWDGWQWSRNTRPRESAARRGSPARGADLGVPPTTDGGRVPGSAGQLLPYSRTAPSVPRTSDGVPLAGWWWRVLAVVIDNMISSTLTAIILGPIYLKLVRGLADILNAILAGARSGQTTPPAISTELLTPREQLIVIGVTLGLQLLYLVGFWRWKAATPGKLVCGLRIVPVDHGRSREKLPWRAILIRAAIWVLPGAQSWLLALKFIDALYPLWHPQRLAIHDLAARTQVVNVRGA